QLRVKLVVGAILATQATSSVDAHDLYLLGLQQWSQRTPESLHKAVDYFTRATQADSSYAQAWAGLALGWAVLPQYDAAVPALPWFQKGQEAAQRALKLEPRSAEANAALGQIAEYSGDVPSAARYLREALRINPNDATAHQWLSEV